MINVKSKNCQHKNCKTQPIYNFENEKKPIEERNIYLNLDPKLLHPKIIIYNDEYFEAF